ncbi:helix-turn-helix domain-containing protein [Aridibaculum aurantiacum]|uniref:helix-turn-helix domain-containing protein n=1 Tax=Aridibaculum aurantiacum TaxID=2810307 RepID=UPI001A960460|nr:helix-turn-helix domain-containing protein [Aridibaculum aurantiacum]
MEKFNGNNGGRRKYNKSRRSQRHEPSNSMYWLDPADVERELNISRSTLRKWEGADLIKSAKLGRKRWYRRIDIDKMLEDHMS